MRAVSSGTGGTGCGRRSDMGDLWTRKSSNAMAPHKAADFANGVRSYTDTLRRPVQKIASQAFEQGVSSGHPFRTKFILPRTFAYLRVSTTGQTTDNQLQEIAAAGFKVEPRRVVTETISGNVATALRRGFARLLDRLEPSDVLVVTKLDRLGRNVMDVGSTVAKLAELGVRVHCLALGGADLTSSTGKLTMNVLNAVAEFERDLLVERTQAGPSRAKSEGKTLGRPLVGDTRYVRVL